MIGAAWLFCGFLVIASVDRLPDPPAIGPHGFDGKALRADAVTRPAPDEPLGVVTPCSGEQLRPLRPVCGAVPEIAGPPRFASIFDAANTSPPRSLVK